MRRTAYTRHALWFALAALPVFFASCHGEAPQNLSDSAEQTQDAGPAGIGILANNSVSTGSGIPLAGGGDGNPLTQGGNGEGYEGKGGGFANTFYDVAPGFACDGGPVLAYSSMFTIVTGSYNNGPLPLAKSPDIYQPDSCQPARTAAIDPSEYDPPSVTGAFLAYQGQIYEATVGASLNLVWCWGGDEAGDVFESVIQYNPETASMTAFVALGGEGWTNPFPVTLSGSTASPAYSAPSFTLAIGEKGAGANHWSGSLNTVLAGAPYSAALTCVVDGN